MAKCQKRQIKVEPPPVEYVLTLTAAEAQALEAFIDSGGKWPGDSSAGVRLNDVRYAILEAL